MSLQDELAEALEEARTGMRRMDWGDRVDALLARAAAEQDEPECTCSDGWLIICPVHGSRPAVQDSGEQGEWREDEEGTVYQLIGDGSMRREMTASIANALEQRQEPRPKDAEDFWMSLDQQQQDWAIEAVEALGDRLNAWLEQRQDAGREYCYCLPNDDLGPAVLTEWCPVHGDMPRKAILAMRDASLNEAWQRERDEARGQVADLQEQVRVCRAALEEIDHLTKPQSDVFLLRLGGIAVRALDALSTTKGGDE